MKIAILVLALVALAGCAVYVPEQRTENYSVCECVTTPYQATCTVQKCTPYQEQVTCTRTVCVPEQRTVNYTVCECVCTPYQATRSVQKCTPYQEQVTLCRMVPKYTQKQVPCGCNTCSSGCGHTNDCCAASCCDSRHRGLFARK